jgi:Zn-dependent protease with chaperone function
MPVIIVQPMGVRRIHRILLSLVALAVVLPSAAAFAVVQPQMDAPGQERVSRSSRSSRADELEPVAVPEAGPLALEFYRSGNWLWILNVVWAVLLPGLLAFSGFSARLRNVAAKLGRVWIVTIGLYVVMYLAIVFLVDLPLSYYEGYVRMHAYGLSNQTLGKWLGDSVIRLWISMTAGFALAWVPYLLLARSPRRWWLYTAILSVPFLFAVMLIKPIWIDPLFNRFGPMKDRVLEQKILAQATRAGIDANRVFEVEKSVDTKAVNAYVTGVFATKRIVLWDTLLAKLNEREVLHVMGHEMGHYVLGHVVRSIVLSAGLTLLGLFLVDWAGRLLVGRYSTRLGFDRLSDVASVPLVLMLLEVAMLLLTPVGLTYSRYQEHEADKYALDLIGDNHSGAMSFVKLMEVNLSNPRPGPIYKFFRSSHPSIGERIDFCNSYRPRLANTLPSVHSEVDALNSPSN